MDAKDIVTTTEYITPKLAQMYLDTSEGNPRWSTERVFSKRVVNKYANAMLNGAWEFNGETISFDSDGHLVDGHHRMAAIIQSGTTVKMRVNRGVSPDVKTYDEGSRRSQAQVMKNKWGVPTSTQLNAGVMVWTIMTEGKTIAESLVTKDLVTILEDDLWFDAKTLCQKSSDKKKPLYIGGAICAVYAALKYGEPYERVSQFVDCAATGFCMDPKDTAAIVANKFLQNEAINNSLTGTDKGVMVSRYLQNCISDFCEGVKKTKKYANPKAVYTDFFAKQYAREAERIRP